MSAHKEDRFIVDVLVIGVVAIFHSVGITGIIKVVNSAAAMGSGSLGGFVMASVMIIEGLSKTHSPRRNRTNNY